MIRVLVTDGMDKKAVSKLQDLGYEVIQEFYEPDVLAEKVKDVDVLVVRSATKVREPIIDAACESGRLKLIIRGGIGVDNIDVDYARSKGIEVCNTPTASVHSVAELAIGHMFALSRFIGISNVTMREGKWEKKAYKGVEITGKTLGIVGWGSIGRETARIARALGMHVIYYSASGKTSDEADFESVKSLDELLSRADIVSLHRAVKKGEPALVTKEFLEKMKPTAFLINTARGALVDEEALADALENGTIQGAALDVYQEEPAKSERLLNSPKVSLTPHIGGSTKEAQARIGEEIVTHILRVFR